MKARILREGLSFMRRIIFPPRASPIAPPEKNRDLSSADIKMRGNEMGKSAARSNELTCQTIVSAYPSHFSKILGDVQTLVRNVAPPEAADASSLVFAANPKAVTTALSSAARAVVIPSKMENSL